MSDRKDYTLTLPNGSEYSIPQNSRIFWIRAGDAKGNWSNWALEHSFIGIGWEEELNLIAHLIGRDDTLSSSRVVPNRALSEPTLRQVEETLRAYHDDKVTHVLDEIQRYQASNPAAWASDDSVRELCAHVEDQTKSKILVEPRERTRFRKTPKDRRIRDLEKRLRKIYRGWRGRILLFCMMSPGDHVVLIGPGGKQKNPYRGFGRVSNEDWKNTTATNTLPGVVPSQVSNSTLRHVEWLRKTGTEKHHEANWYTFLKPLNIFKAQAKRNFPNGTTGMSTVGTPGYIEAPETSVPKGNPKGLISRITKKKVVSPMRKNMDLHTTLLQSTNIVLEGVPGTGKTFSISEVCADWPDRTDRPLQGEGRKAYAITLHPATTYEDFVEGLRPAAPPSLPKEDSENAEHEPSVLFDAQNPGPRKANPAHLETTTQPSETRDEAKWAKSVSNREQGEQVDHIVSRSAFLNYFHVWNPAIHGPSEGSTTFRMQDGFFLRVCAEAVNNPNNDYVVLLDEINRCNVPKVMGDLLTTIERSKRAKWVESDGGYWDLSKCQVVTLPGSKRLFFVPENVYVVATMNTTDRSVAPLDAALRRRFAFVRLWPKGFDPSDDRKEPYDFWKDEFQEDQKSSIGKLWTEGGPPEEFKTSLEAWIALNKKLSELGPDAMLGHSYLFDLAEDMLADESKHKDAVRHHWNFHILPQLIDMAVSNNLEAKLVVPGSKPATAELGDVTKVVSEPLSKSGFTLKGTLPASSGLLQVPTLTLVDNASIGGNIASTGEEILFRDATPTKLTSPDNWKDDQHRFFYVPKLSFRESALKSAAEKGIDLEHAKPAIIVQSATRTDWPSKVYGHRADAVKAIVNALPDTSIRSVYVSDTSPPTIKEVRKGDQKVLPHGNHRFAILLNEPLKKEDFDKLMNGLKKSEGYE